MGLFSYNIKHFREFTLFLPIKLKQLELLTLAL